jgi:hypothetical protein
MGLLNGMAMLQPLIRYYGIDWLLFILVVMHLWMLGNKCRSAFIFGAMACCCGFCFGILIESIATILMNIVFFSMHVRAYIRWGKD